MVEVLLVLAGLVVGGLIVWLARSARVAVAKGTVAELRAQIAKAEQDFHAQRAQLQAMSNAKVKAETQYAEAARNLEAQKKFIEDSKQALENSFEALSGRALSGNREAFLALAKKSLEAVMTDGRSEIEKRRQAVEELVKPLRDSLRQYEEHVRVLEKSRQAAYTSLHEQIKSLNETQLSLRDKTDSLVTALRRPEVRGRWGELSLRRVAELAGMVEHCDFEEQVSVQGEDGRLRPDMIVQLPAGRQIVVDAKLPLDAYLDAISAESEDQRTEHLVRHARQMRTHMRQLSAKSYWEQFPQAPEFVVMFIPGESFFAAAVEQQPSLIEDGMRERVVLATPTTLIALLRAVAYGWRQEQITRNAQVICDLGKQLYERLQTFSEHFENIRKSLERANESFNKAVGSLETRVFPAARRFKDLGVATGEDIEVVEPVERTPRVLNPPDTEQQD